jgi:hypothetical protein
LSFPEMFCGVLSFWSLSSPSQHLLPYLPAVPLLFCFWRTCIYFVSLICLRIYFFFITSSFLFFYYVSYLFVFFPSAFSSILTHLTDTFAHSHTPLHIDTFHPHLHTMNTKSIFISCSLFFLFFLFFLSFSFPFSCFLFFYPFFTFSFSSLSCGVLHFPTTVFGVFH